MARRGEVVRRRYGSAVFPTQGPFLIWPHLLTVEYDHLGDPWALVCRQCVGALPEEEPFLIAYVESPDSPSMHGEYFTYGSASDLVVIAAHHLEELSDYFPRFDRGLLEDCAFMAAVANDPFPGIRALLEGRQDCQVITEAS